MVKSETPDPKHFQGYGNNASMMFSMTWNNDQAMYNDFVEHAAGYWVQEDYNNNPTACGFLIVSYAHDYYTGKGDGHEGKNFFSEIDPDEWDDINCLTVGEEIRDAIKNHGRYAHLLEPVPDQN